MRGAFPSKPRHGIQLKTSHSLARGLLARFLINEGAGILLFDLATRKNHATLVNMDTPTAWRGSTRGMSLAFDGVDDIVASTLVGLNGANQGSMLAWFRTTTAPAGPNQIVSAPSAGATVSGMTLRITSPTQMSAAANVGGVNTAATATLNYSDGLWHQVVTVYDGTNLILYFDGVQKASTGGTGTIAATDAALAIGGLGAGLRLYTGQVGDVRVYNRALTPGEVARLYADPYADMATFEIWERRDRDHATLEIEAELKGAGNGWSDLSMDLALNPTLTIDYGISGAGPLDLVASPGTMTFALKNGENNTTGTVGLYSPQHANCLTGFKLGIGIRFRYSLGGVVYYKFAGWLDTIDPIPGAKRDRKVVCTVLDYMDQAMRQRVSIATQIGKSADQILTTLVAAGVKKPASTSFDTGDSTFAFAIDNSDSESQPMLTEFQRLMLSEGGGHLSVRGDTTAGGQLHFEKRTARVVPIPAASFSNTMIEMTAAIERSTVVNRVLTTIHPRRVDTLATTVLFSNQGTPAILSGATLMLTGQYNDPANRASRVGGKDFTTPVATAISTSSVASPTVITTATPHGYVTGETVVIYSHAGSTPSINGTVYTITVTGASTFTIPVNVTVGGTGGFVVADYRLNTLADGTGTDLTSSLSITATYGANSVDYTLVNSGADAFVTKLQARGRGLYDYDQVQVTQLSQTSIDAYGENKLEMDMPYQGDAALGVTVGAAMLAVYGSQRSTPSIRFQATNAADLAIVLQIEPGSVVAVTETVTGITSLNYWVNHVSLQFTTLSIVTAEWQLALGTSV